MVWRCFASSRRGQHAINDGVSSSRRKGWSHNQWVVSLDLFCLSQSLQDTSPALPSVDGDTNLMAASLLSISTGAHRKFSKVYNAFLLYSAILTEEIKKQMSYLPVECDGTEAEHSHGAEQFVQEFDDLAEQQHAEP